MTTVIEPDHITTPAKRLYYRDIGWLNDWYHNPPPDYVRCQDAHHPLETVTEGWLCITRYRCPKCMIVWRVDSGD